MNVEKIQQITQTLSKDGITKESATDVVEVFSYYGIDLALLNGLAAGKKGFSAARGQLIKIKQQVMKDPDLERFFTALFPCCGSSDIKQIKKISAELALVFSQYKSGFDFVSTFVG
jgi:hypothetical protein